MIAYNRFSSEINRLLNRYDAFQDEFSNIVFRQLQGVSNKTPLNSEPLLER